MQRRLIAASLCLAAIMSPMLSGQMAAAETQVSRIKKMKVYPLPGKLDALPMLNSNRPEIVSSSGILVSTLPERPGSYFLNYAFDGDFGVFSHHIVKDMHQPQNTLYLGLLVSNHSLKPVTLTLKQGASYLSQPEAIFKDLPPNLPNPEGEVYAGPGDRVTTEMLLGKSPLRPMSLVIPARSTQLVMSLPVPSNVQIPSMGGGSEYYINGRSTLAYFHSDGPLYASHVAYLAPNGAPAPGLEEYQALLDARQLAGTRPAERPTPYREDMPPPEGKFILGRVAGVSQGLSWNGKLFDKTRILERPARGETVAYPIASTYLKRFGTQQNQSGLLMRRYGDSAHQNHGNYGVRYNLDIPLHNDTPQFASYALGLSQPAAMNGSAQNAEFLYLYPPNKPIVYRGSVSLKWRDEYNQVQRVTRHLTMRHGEDLTPISTVTVPPGTHYDLKLSLYYPPDATPPQLLTLQRIQ